MSDCKNCSLALPEAAKYCPACGQSVLTLQRPWTEVIRELLEELLDIDGRMFVSAQLLMTRPGLLAREYIRGRRKTYTPPLRMYLVISLAFFFVLPSIIPEVPGQEAAQGFSVDLYSRGMFILLPIHALLLKLFYRETFFLSHLIFTVYLFSFLYVVFGALLALEPLADQYLALMLAQLVLLLWMLIYFTFALRFCFGGSWAMTALKMFSLLLMFSAILGMSIEAVSQSGLT